MKLRAYGKVNLFLDIIGKREDGYHNIETIIQRIDLFDEIILSVDKKFNGIDIKIVCDHEMVPTDNKNLCYIACKWFMEMYNLCGKVLINIKKNIPILAGLGGGTSDGAEIIRALIKIYDLNVNIKFLSGKSVRIGGDFPYSLIGGTALCEGIGEKVTRLKSFCDKIIVIVKPNFGFSTRDVYKNFSMNSVGKINRVEFVNYLENGDFHNVCKNISNVLEFSNVPNMDIIRAIKLRFINLGAINSSMSGSGSSVYGLFDNLYIAQKCYDEFKNSFNEVFITKTINM